MKIAFTIVTKNYVGLAKVLGESIILRDPNVKFYVFIADEFDSSFKAPNDNFTYIECKNHLDIDKNLWNKMSFQYNLTEFCTSIKPFCFKYLMNSTKNTKLIYFDPDILVFSKLDYIWDKLDHFEAVVTPHISSMEVNYTGDMPEINILGAGMFNLGFLGLRNSNLAIKICDWWKSRLIDKCFSEKTEHLFTDQKWMNFLPCFLTSDQLYISRNLGLNVAPWNFFERKLTIINDQFFIVNRISEELPHELYFVHYSGFNYKELKANNNKNIASLKVYEDLNPIFDRYIDVLKLNDVPKYFIYPYTYGIFSNGKPILNFHRRLFRRLSSDNYVRDNPFDANNTFYKICNKRKLIVSNNDNYDKLNNRNFEGFDRKIYYVNLYNKFLFRILGAKKYFLYARFMLKYYRVENQVYLFSDDYNKNNFVHENM
jgi:hypothetical protein